MHDNNFIITDGKISIDWFLNFFRSNPKKVIVKTSGGTSSSLALYLLAKYVHENNYELKIYPFFAHDLDLMCSNAYENLPKIINLIHNEFPNSNIQKLEIFKFSRNKNFSIRKNTLINTYQKQYAEKISCKTIVSGSTLNLKEMVSEYLGTNIYGWQIGERYRDTFERHSCIMDLLGIQTPWVNVDKHFIAHQYKKIDFMKNIFPLTETCNCVNTLEYGKLKRPCKLCYPCKQKFIAFGCY